MSADAIAEAWRDTYLRVAWCPTTGEVARLDATDEGAREAEIARWRREGFVEVPPPRGLVEWRWRSEFVATRVAEPIKSRLGRMLRRGKGRWGFERALALHPDVRAEFRAFRHHQLVAYAASWLDPQSKEAGCATQSEAKKFG